jgi:DNA invertase Pin-like site-specific DNA recombinase
MGRFAIGILTLIAELELERIKSGWEAAVSEAVGRGIHISARPPTGYRRDEDGRLLRDEPAASFVAEAFRSGQQASPGRSLPTSSKRMRSTRRAETSTGRSSASPG